MQGGNWSYLFLWRGLAAAARCSFALHPSHRILLGRVWRLPFDPLASGRPNIEGDPHRGRVHIGVGVGVGVNDDDLTSGGELAPRVARLGPGAMTALLACHGRLRFGAAAFVAVLGSLRPSRRRPWELSRWGVTGRVGEESRVGVVKGRRGKRKSSGPGQIV